VHLLYQQYNKTATNEILTTNYSINSKISKNSIGEIIVQSMAVALRHVILGLSTSYRNLMNYAENTKNPLYRGEY
jgi:hypothetical protein